MAHSSARRRRSDGADHTYLSRLSAARPAWLAYGCNDADQLTSVWAPHHALPQLTADTDGEGGAAVLSSSAVEVAHAYIVRSQKIYGGAP